MQNAGEEEGGPSCGSEHSPDSGRATKLISTLRIRQMPGVAFPQNGFSLSDSGIFSSHEWQK